MDNSLRRTIEKSLSTFEGRNNRKAELILMHPAQVEELKDGSTIPTKKYFMRGVAVRSSEDLGMTDIEIY